MINRTTTVAYGAAVAASWQIQDPMAIDEWATTKNPHTISVQIDNGTIQEVIHRNSCINCTETIQCTTTVDYQERSHIRLFEGDEDISGTNRLINEFSLQLQGVWAMP
jgi:molecular chaperone DnaK (HSP70)